MKPEEIRAYRQKLGYTQGELATALGVAPNTVSRWELGTAKPESPEMLTLALEALEVRMALNDKELLKLEREVTAKIKRMMNR